MEEIKKFFTSTFSWVKALVLAIIIVALIYRFFILLLVALAVLVFYGIRESNLRERYFLIIPLEFSSAIKLFKDFLSKQLLLIDEQANAKKIGWLSKKKREDCRVYNFYAFSETCTIIAEIINQKGTPAIDFFFGEDDAKRLSELSSGYVYYVSYEHLQDLYEIYNRGQEVKKLIIDTHGNCVSSYWENEKLIEEQELKKRNYSSLENHIKDLGVPIDIHSHKINDIIKKGKRKERYVFRRSGH